MIGAVTTFLMLLAVGDRLEAASPSKKPTNNPSKMPKIPPVYVAGTPTKVPSVIPPTRKPSFRPTLEPSRPTRTPTREPSRPTRKPTASPSKPSRRPVPTTSVPTAKPTVPIPRVTAKRGMVENPVSGDPNDIGAVWYWNYRPRLLYFDIRWPNAKFIPTIKEPKDIGLVRQKNPELLFTFNEPDVPTSGAFMPAKTLATKWWPLIEATRPVILTCPAMAKRNLISYLTEFLKGNGTYRPRCDAINVHWHDFDANIILQFMDEAYATFRRDLYISEFSMADWVAAKLGRHSFYTEQDVLEFIHVSVNGFEARPFIKGYSWYSAIDHLAHDFASLFNADHSVRPAGRLYAGLSPYPTGRASAMNSSAGVWV